MSDLTEFLLARIAEDEAAARDVIASLFNGYRVNELIHPDIARHIYRWTPGRVLAECEAKRRIIAFHESWPVLIQTEPSLELTPETWVAKMTSDIAWLTNAEYVKRFGTDPPTAPMLLAMAQAYADHPDYREEWRA